MPVLQGRTREQIRVSIGRNLGAIFTGVATDAGSTTTILDSTQSSGDNDHNGKWIVFTSGTNDGRIRRVDDYTGSTGSYAIRAAPTTLASTAEGDTYELWDEEYPPDRVHDAINDAIVDITGRAFDPVEDTSLFFDNETTRFDIPSGITMINGVYYRSDVTEKVLDEADSAWTEHTNSTVTADTELKKRGTGSNKIEMNASIGAGNVIAYLDITSIDISKYTHLEWWARCSKTTSANDFKFLLDNTSGSSSPIELLGFPALTQDTWKRCRVALAKADEDTAITSIGIEDDVDAGAETLWIDDVRVVDNNSSVWSKLPTNLWKIDKGETDLILTDPGRCVANYSAMKLTGGDTPALLSADATVTEVHASYVIAKATSLMLEWNGLGPTDGDKSRTYWSSVWGARADRWMSKFDILRDARMVS